MPLAPMGCAMQLHQGSEKQTLWGANTINGLYLQTSQEHYRCYVIYAKQTRSKRVSDTVFFKTKYIMQPTLTQADVISKALNDLTQALKGKSNQQRLEQIDALKKLDAILNNESEPVPTATITRPTQWRVTFDEAAKALMEMEPREATGTPRVNKQPQQMQTKPIHTSTIEKTIPKAPTLRVLNKQVARKITPARMDTRERIRKYIKEIPQ